MPWRDIVLFNPCSSSLWLLIPSGTTEEFKGPGEHNLKWLCTMCCIQHNPLSLIEAIGPKSLILYYFDSWSNVLVCFRNSSQSLGRGLRRGLRAGPAPEEEAAPQSDHLHCGAAGRAGEGLRTHALPWHLHARGAGSEGQAHGGASSGWTHAQSHYSTPKILSALILTAEKYVGPSWVCVMWALNCLGMLPHIPNSH